MKVALGSTSEETKRKKKSKPKKRYFPTQFFQTLYLFNQRKTIRLDERFNLNHNIK